MELCKTKNSICCGFATCFSLPNWRQYWRKELLLKLIAAQKLKTQSPYVTQRRQSWCENSSRQSQESSYRYLRWFEDAWGWLKGNSYFGHFHPPNFIMFYKSNQFWKKTSCQLTQGGRPWYPGTTRHYWGASRGTYCGLRPHWVKQRKTAIWVLLAAWANLVFQTWNQFWKKSFGSNTEADPNTHGAQICHCTRY